MYSNRTNLLPTGGRRGCTSRRAAFSLLEVLTALAILAFACSSVLLVINRSMVAAADSAFQMEAFQLARENMERILLSESITENVEYGTSEQYSDISWKAVTEAFSESTTGKMWVRVVSSAEYPDAMGETQTVELVHWVTMLSDQQADQIMEDEDLEALAAEQLLEDIELAAEYAGVDVETITAWMDGGLLTTQDGQFIRHNLDIYVDANGEPTEEQQGLQVESIEELAMVLYGDEGQDEAEAPEPDQEGESDPEGR